MVYVVLDSYVDLVLHHQRFEDHDSLDPTFTELNNMIKTIKNWEYVSLEKEKFKEILFYDEYAVRVYIDEIFVGYIDRVNSPIVNLLMDYTVADTLILHLKAEPTFEKDIIKNIRLFVKATTESKELFDVVKVELKPNGNICETYES